jgi:Ca2+-binding EF-hand superfamily protein
MTRYLLIAAAAGALSTQAGAQAGPGGMGGAMQADLTRQQAQQLADGLFQRLDLNHDGTLTRDEAEQARAQMAGGGGSGDRAERMIVRMFGDAQSVTLAQFEAQALARFDRQDLNHDGVVTSVERQQSRANRSQGN